MLSVFRRFFQSRTKREPIEAPPSTTHSSTVQLPQRDFTEKKKEIQFLAQLVTEAVRFKLCYKCSAVDIGAIYSHVYLPRDL